MVFIHELGHFLVAKKLGIKVEEFGFGFPPKAWGKKIGETIYSINWLPIGGFVKLYGEDDAGGGKVKIQDSKFKIQNSELKRAFFARPVRQRVAVVIAGVVMNVLLAAFIYYLFLGISNFRTELPLLNDHRFFFVNQVNQTDLIITNVEKGSPAEEIGLKQYVRIVSINGAKVEDMQEFSQIVKQLAGKSIILEWEDMESGKISSARVVPRVSPPPGQGALGISFFPAKRAVLSYKTLPQKIFSGFTHSANLTVYNIDILSQLVTASLRDKSVEPLGQGVAGPVGIFSLVGSIVQIPDIKERVLGILNLAGVLSISLAFFNILPIPALDGGRLFFILVEGITGKKINPKIEGYIHSAGMAVLLGLVALITFKDLRQLIFK